MKALFLYITAKYDSRIIDNEQLQETLQKAKNNEFDTIIIIKKTQIVAKTKKLEKDFMVKSYPIKSIKKAINNANACLIIQNGKSLKRKKPISEQIIQEATKKSKLTINITM